MLLIAQNVFMETRSSKSLSLKQLSSSSENCSRFVSLQENWLTQEFTALLLTQRTNA